MQLDHLRKERRAAAFDLRGHGLSDLPSDGDYWVETLAEDIGIGSRAGYYDGIGSARDVIQNHLLQLLAAKESATCEPIYAQTAAVHAKNDWGTSYVEVSLTDQYLWLYKDGKCILESYFVSGNPNRGHATPKGIYGLTYKTRDATLSGEGYDSKVKYWMPFNRNVGLHDAPWRKTFGGQIYKNNGSHGCINLPPANAAKIYENVDKNTPVIVY